MDWVANGLERDVDSFADDVCAVTEASAAYRCARCEGPYARQAIAPPPSDTTDWHCPPYVTPGAAATVSHFAAEALPLLRPLGADEELFRTAINLLSQSAPWSPTDRALILKVTPK